MTPFRNKPLANAHHINHDNVHAKQINENNALGNMFKQKRTCYQARRTLKQTRNRRTKLTNRRYNKRTHTKQTAKTRRAGVQTSMHNDLIATTVGRQTRTTN